jgi:endonuclease IV
MTEKLKCMINTIRKRFGNDHQHVLVSGMHMDNAGEQQDNHKPFQQMLVDLEGGAWGTKEEKHQKGYVTISSPPPSQGPKAWGEKGRHKQIEGLRACTHTAYMHITGV